MTQLIIKTEYDASTDTITAFVHRVIDAVEEPKPAAVVTIEHNAAEISTNDEIDPDDQMSPFESLQDGLNDMPVVNAVDLMSRVIRALIDATDEDTDIPMHIDEPITLQI